MHQRIMYKLFRAIVRRDMMMPNKLCADVIKLYADAFQKKIYIYIIVIPFSLYTFRPCVQSSGVLFVGGT